MDVLLAAADLPFLPESPRLMTNCYYLLNKDYKSSRQNIKLLWTIERTIWFLLVDDSSWWFFRLPNPGCLVTEYFFFCSFFFQVRRQQGRLALRPVRLRRRPGRPVRSGRVLTTGLGVWIGPHASAAWHAHSVPASAQRPGQHPLGTIHSAPPLPPPAPHKNR